MKRYLIFSVCVVGCTAIVWSYWPWFEEQAVPLGGLAAVVAILGGLYAAGKHLYQQTEPDEPLPPVAPVDIPESPARAFERRYRAQQGDRFANYDAKGLGLTLAGPGRRPEEGVKLEDIFLEPRLGEGYDLDKLDVGERIPPAAIAARTRHLAVKGPAGAGKTTWMQWLFRRLLHEGKALPIFIELRKLAYDWSRREAGPDRSLNETIERWAAELGCEGLREYLDEPDALRPVLLVDGWDELGDLAHDVRLKLRGFLRTHTNALAVVTSRPYGEARPDESREGDDLDWETRDIQPLDDDEIKTLALNYNRECFPDEARKPEERTEQFLSGLASSHGAERLARTPLLLTMLLAIGRTRELPDRRHELYGLTIDALLERPIGKEKEGARFESWRPEWTPECKRVSASLAYSLQSRTERWTGPILAEWDELKALLPWKGEDAKRDGFLAWLSGPAALLEERVDGKLAFGHLSFQEFLAAWDRSRKLATAEERTAFLDERLGTQQWWETLRLWAALLQDEHGVDAVEPILKRCFVSTPLQPIPSMGVDAVDLGSPEGLALAGVVLADGVGSEMAFEQWGSAFSGRLAVVHWNGDAAAAVAWKNSRQGTRRQRLAGLLAPAADAARWGGWLRLDEWREAAGAGAIRMPRAGRLAERIIDCLGRGPRSDLDLGAARVWCGADPAWPGEPWELALLQVWPGQRRLEGIRLEGLVAACGRSSLAGAAPKALAARGALSREQEALGRSLAHDWVTQISAPYSPRDVHYSAPDRERYWARDLACYWAREWTQDWTREFVRNSERDWRGDRPRDHMRDFAQEWARDWTQYVCRQLTPDLTRALAQHSALVWARHLVKYWAHYAIRDVTGWFWAKDCAQYWGLVGNSPQAHDFAEWDVLSLGRGAARARVASLRHGQSEPAVELMASGCRLSLRPENGPDEFEAALAAYQASPDPDPLWPALARHLARRREEGDWELLEDLARHPEKREPPLSWGLRFIVRGDLVLDDGSVVELDDLSREHGLEPLPYLEELPEEIELGE